MRQLGFALCFAMVGCFDGGSQPAPDSGTPTDGSNPLNDASPGDDASVLEAGTQTWTDGTTLSSSVLIPAGATVTIAPGATITNFSQRHLYDEQGNVSQEKFDAFVERMKGFSPLNIVGEAMDQALLILYLVSPAGRYATGNIFRVNGGQATAW